MVNACGALVPQYFFLKAEFTDASAYGKVVGTGFVWSPGLTDSAFYISALLPSFPGPWSGALGLVPFRDTYVREGAV